MSNITTDTEVILNALQKERDELHDRIMQVDRIIKRVKSLEYTQDKEVKEPQQLENKEPIAPLNLFPKTADIKVMIVRAFDMLGKATRQRDVQLAYNDLSGNQYSVRESMKTLNRNKVLVRVVNKTTGKSFLWAKSDWIIEGQLIDKYKPEGFDLLHKSEDLIFQ